MKKYINIFYICTSLLSLSLLLFYSGIWTDCSKIPFSLSITESQNLWALKSLLNHQKLRIDLFSFNQFTESFFFIKVLSLYFNLGFKQLSVLVQGRLISSVGLVFCLTIFGFLLKREKVNNFIILWIIGLFLAFPVTQACYGQLRSEFWSLAFGVGALYFLFKSDKNISWWQSILVSVCLALAYIFSHKSVFLSFAFASFCLLSNFNNWQSLIKIYLPTMLLILADYLFQGLSFGFHTYLDWDLQRFIHNFNIIYNWPILSLILIFLFNGKELKSFQINVKHPAFTLLIISLIINLWSTGLRLDYSYAWLIPNLAFCWLLALSLNQFILQEFKQIFGFLSLAAILMGLLIHLIPPQAIKTIQNYPKLIHNTENWIRETKAILKQNPEIIISQDPNISALLTEKDCLFVDPNILIYSSKAYQKMLKGIKAKKYNQIILTTSPEQIWPNEIIKQIKKNYDPYQKIFILGESGLVYRKKEDFGMGSSSNKNGESLTETEIFATFHPI